MARSFLVLLTCVGSAHSFGHVRRRNDSGNPDLVAPIAGSTHSLGQVRHDDRGNPDAVAVVAGRMDGRRASALHQCWNGVDTKDRDVCVGTERLLFLHIPKNAGSAIEEAAIKEGVKWGKYMFEGCDLGEGNCHANWHEPPALMGAVNIYSEAKVFCVIRNPYTRMVSEYKYIYDNPEFRWENYGLIEAEGCTSSGLNLWLDRILRKYLAGDTYEQLCHMLPQPFYIYGPPDSWGQQCQYCHEILRVEEFPGAFNSLMERYDYNIRLDPKPVNVGGCKDLSEQDIDSANIALIQEVYFWDFRMLNYSIYVQDA